MRYLILPVLGNEDHRELKQCLVPLCEPLCRLIVTEGHRFRDYMLRDRFQIVKIAWRRLPALYWYESLPKGIATLAGSGQPSLLDIPDEFGESLQVLDMPEDFAWPSSAGDCDLLVLSNADFVRDSSPPQPNLWVLWSTTLLEDGDGYDYHSTAAPLSFFEQYLASSLQLLCER
jgi:hypothetical protein